jgi:hypothetical protein
MRQHYEWREEEREAREHEATMRTLAEAQTPQLPQITLPEASPELVRALVIGLVISGAFFIFNPMIVRFLSSVPHPFSIIATPLIWLSGSCGALTIAIFLLLIIVLVRSVNPRKPG